MKKLFLQMQITMDGFVSGPNGELDWMVAETDPNQINQLTELTNRMDTILMGRNMTGGFTHYWENVVDNQPDSPEYPYAKIFVDTPKVVFSRTVQSLPGRNVTVENGDLIAAVNALKNQPGKDMIVYGGANFVSELVRHNLIDEYYLFIHPVTLGEGKKIFFDRNKFQLVSATVCSNGLLVNNYRRQ